MQTRLQSSRNAQRAISLLAIIAVSVGIALAAHGAGRRPLSREAKSVQALEAENVLAAARIAAVRPRFERSNEPAIDVDPMNAHGG